MGCVQSAPNSTREAQRKGSEPDTRHMSADRGSQHRGSYNKHESNQTPQHPGKHDSHEPRQMPPPGRHDNHEPKQAPQQPERFGNHEPKQAPQQPERFGNHEQKQTPQRLGRFDNKGPEPIEEENIDAFENGAQAGATASRGASFESITNICSQPPQVEDMQVIGNENSIFMIESFKYNPSQPDRAPNPINVGNGYDDRWDENHLRMPCSPKYVDAYSQEEKDRFLRVTLPKMCDLVLTLEAVCPQAPPLLRIGSNRSVTMSQKQAASLLACSFFCLFPNSSNRKQPQDADNYQNPNFDRLYANGPPQKMEKLKCILNYFRRVTEKMPNGVITFQRYMLPSESYPSWRNSSINLGDLHLTTSKKIEEVQNTLQADFANKYIGGGVLGSGCVQEEIRFSICPEMLVSLLVCEVMEDNECIFLIGCEQYSSYRGYAHSFQFDGDYKDTTPKDNWGRKWCHLVAMDAIYFRDPSTQYNMKAIDRELIKAFTSFRPLGKGSNYEFGITTGNWGCGAFNGDKQLKAIIQWMAASVAGRPLIYAAFGDKKLIETFYEIYDILKKQRATGVSFDDIINICPDPPHVMDMEQIQDENSIFMISPFKFDPTHPEREPTSIYCQNNYSHRGDMNHVHMPCSPHNTTKDKKPVWSLICKSLIELKNMCDTDTATVENLTIYSIDERRHFMSTVLSNICSLALNVGLVCPQPPPLLRTGSNRSVTMSQKQAASLLACSFFCLFPNRSYSKRRNKFSSFPHANFISLYKTGHPKNIEKLKCILHYFRRITEEMPNGVITIRRFSLPKQCLPLWHKSHTSLCDLHLTTSKKIEEVQNTLQADFANKYIGGGVLGSGCVQEEIRFSISPEMLVSLLVCEVMEDNECIFLIGCEQYSSYKGYANSFQFAGDYRDPTPKDTWGRKWCHLVAMDAIYFRDSSKQYNIKAVDRELIKAYTSFYPLGRGPNYEFGITTGNWGCGAFNGDRYLKAIIQWMAASEAKRPLIYAAYRNKNLVNSFNVVYEYLKDQKATVADLYQYIQQYLTQVERGTLFEYILNTPVSFLK
ncbi:unnamed protein product [Adineta steineri]|uniref:poly(ADP-ribose) glycohydrolase n=2 Tax=Adineta steineri TaxID=433720 RepID=A0A814MGX6_9BILA|nr:unnamed protein product [Adineta steineri]CAF1079190.1 unnamed protein product [Adineta steineri]